MASIDDFLDHLWANAKEELRELDRDYVSRVESAARLQAVGLEASLPYGVSTAPAQRLSTEWHRLLEACTELRMQVDCVRIAAKGLTGEANNGLPSYEAGVQSDFHFRSWFMHVDVMAGRA